MRLSERLSRGCDQDGLVVVSAPAGYGKTVAVAAWAAQVQGPVAWLRLTSFDSDASRLVQGIVRALQGLAYDSREDLADLLLISPLRQHTEDVMRQLLAALEMLEEPVSLVIDDAHRATDGSGIDVIDALISARPDALRLVLVGTSRLRMGLARHLLTNPHAELGPTDLSFTRDEVAELRELTGASADPAMVHVETQGWPIAVRVMLLAGGKEVRDSISDTDVLVREYVHQHLLSALPEELRRFVLEATVVQEISAPVAMAITGRADAAAMLDRCASLGLFLDRYESGRSTAYRWHAVFARHCQQIAGLEDAGAVAGRLRRAARAVEGDAPLVAAERWIEASDPGEAVRVILGGWVRLVLGTDAAGLDRVCAMLPEPFASDPRITLVRACAQDQIGEEQVARMHLARAQAAAERERPNGYELVHVIACLMLHDDRAKVLEAGDLVRQAFIENGDIAPSQHAAVLYVLAWAHMRVRSAPDRILELLTATERESEAIGDHDLASRCRRHRAVTYAWAGMLVRGSEVLVEIDSREGLAHSTWVGADRGTREMAVALIAYWRNEPDTALPQLDRMIRNSSSVMGIDGAARLVLALVAASARRPPLMRRAAQELIAVPHQDMHGWSWAAFRQCSMIVLDEAAGRRDRAVARARGLATQAQALPLVGVAVAGVLRRGNDMVGALSLLEGMGHYRRLPFVRVAGLATSALAHRRRGATELAHETIERALEAASAEGIRRPFCEGELELREFLAEHIAWGSAHDDFIASCLTERDSGSAMDLLSVRERAVFEQLRTNRTMQEIAEAMGVSINTVKTHQRAIYRKLGVASRREAVRLFV